MLDMRYHIVSLVAVFLALSIGIIVGTVIVDKGTLDKGQKTLVAKLEKEFGDLRAENAKLNSKVNQSDQYAQQTYSQLIKDRLEGQNIAVVITSPIDVAIKRSVLEALHAAGATYSCVSLSQSWNLDDKAVLTRVTPYIAGVEGESAQQRLLYKLADFYAAPPGDSKLLADCAQLGLLSVEVDNTARPSAVLLIGGSDERNSVNEVDVQLIERLKANKVRVVGTETTTRKTSYMSAYQRAGISTVDDVDERAGQVSTIFMLAGASGNFGIKPTASQLVPSMSAQ